MNVPLVHLYDSTMAVLRATKKSGNLAIPKHVLFVIYDLCSIQNQHIPHKTSSGVTNLGKDGWALIGCSKDTF